MACYNSQTCMTLGEHILKNCLKFLSRNCRCCLLDDVFMAILFVSVVLINMDRTIPTGENHMKLDQVNEETGD